MYPRRLAIEETVEYVLVGKDRMLRNTVQEDLEHTFALRDHSHVLFCLGLLDCIVANALLRRYWGDNESRIKLGETYAEGFKLRVAATRFRSLE